MISWRGPRSNEHRDQITEESIRFQVLGQPALLPIVASYKHVGIAIGEFGSCSVDVSAKSAAIQQTARS